MSVQRLSLCLGGVLEQPRVCRMGRSRAIALQGLFDNQVTGIVVDRFHCLVARNLSVHILQARLPKP